MKRKLWIFILIIALLSACGAKTNETADGTWPKHVTIATATSSGTMYYIGAGQCQILNDKIEGINFAAESTDGSFTTNGSLVQNTPDCLSLVAISAMQDALEGVYVDMPGVTMDKLRLVMVGHATTLQFVTLKETGITSLEDIKGKRLGTAIPGSVARTATLQLLNAMGYEESDFAALTAMTVTDMGDALKDGTIDIAVVNGGRPTAAVSDLNSTRDIVMLQVPMDILDKAVAENPSYKTYVITSDDYSDMTEDCVILGIPMGLVCNADMDEELVYEITKALNEGTEQLTAAHVDGADWNTENSLDFYQDGIIPFHSGAARYYDEVSQK